MKHLFIALLGIVLLHPAQAQNYKKVKHTRVSLYPFLQDSLYGYADDEGKLIIQPQYEEASLFGNKSNILECRPFVRRGAYRNSQVDILPPYLAEVKKDNHWQLIDTTGSVVMELGNRKSEVRELYSLVYPHSEYPRIKIGGDLRGYRIESKDTIGRIIFYHKRTNKLSESYKYIFENCPEDEFLWSTVGQTVGTKDACIITQTFDSKYDILSVEGEVLLKDIDPNLPCNEEKVNGVCDELIKIRDEKLREINKNRPQRVRPKKERSKKERSTETESHNKTVREYFFDTHMYTISEGDSISIYSEKGQIVVPLIHKRLSPIRYLNEDRVLLEKKDGYTILNGSGEGIDIIDVHSGSYGHRTRVANWFPIRIAGKQMLVFSDKEGGRRFSGYKRGTRPFLYDIEKLKEYRN